MTGTEDAFFFRHEPANNLADIIEVVLFDMSGSHSPKEIQEWKAVLLSRPDSESEEIKEALAVCDNFLRSLHEDLQDKHSLQSDRGKCQSG